MAARLNRLDTERVVTRIKASKLVDRLQAFALAEPVKYPTGGKGGSTPGETREKTIVMTDGEVRATCFLLERVLAKAEAPKTFHVSLTLSELIKKSLARADANRDL